MILISMSISITAIIYVIDSNYDSTTTLADVSINFLYSTIVVFAAAIIISNAATTATTNKISFSIATT